MGDKRADPFDWWRTNGSRYMHIATLARDILAIPASSLCSEQCFSIAGNLVEARRSRLSDDSIRAAMLVRAWNIMEESIKLIKPSKSFRSSSL